MLNEYEISYIDFPEGYPKVGKSKRVVVGRGQAPNGISAIKFVLTKKFEGQKDLIDAILDGRSIGSNKRLIVAGITFEAKKL